jgi:hypothetical protein
MKPLVQVTWRDARDSDDTWSDEADIAEFSATDVTIVSIGYLISDGPKFLTLAGDWNTEDSHYGRVCKIPQGMVLEKKPLVTLTLVTAENL